MDQYRKCQHEHGCIIFESETDTQMSVSTQRRKSILMFVSKKYRSLKHMVE